MRRVGKLVDVASLVIFLAPDDSNYIIGQTIVYDGGVTQRLITG